MEKEGPQAFHLLNLKITNFHVNDRTRKRLLKMGWGDADILEGAGQNLSRPHKKV